jgi:hypothetical protein
MDNSPSPAVQVHFTLTQSEFVRAAMRRSWRIYRWVVFPCVLLGLLLLVPPQAPPSHAHSGAIEFFLIAGALVVFAWLITTFTFRSIPADKKTSTWSFHPEHIDVASEMSHATMRWRAFVKVEETRAAFSSTLKL